MKKILSTLIIVAALSVSASAGFINSAGFACNPNEAQPSGMTCTQFDGEIGHGNRQAAEPEDDDSVLNVVKAFIFELFG